MSEFWIDVYEKTIRCTQCNLCILGCPMFFGTRRDYYSPRALVVLLRESAKTGSVPEHLLDLLFFCNLCGNCNVRCPAKIDIVELVKIVRERLIGSEAS